MFYCSTKKKSFVIKEMKSEPFSTREKIKVNIVQQLFFIPKALKLKTEIFRNVFSVFHSKFLTQSQPTTCLYAPRNIIMITETIFI